MKHTRKTQLAWIRSIIEALPADMINAGMNAYEMTAANLRAVGCGPDGVALWGGFQTWTDAAKHFLQGCGLHGFPIYPEDHAELLRAWGYTPTQKMLDNFFDVSAGLLVEVLREMGFKF